MVTTKKTATQKPTAAASKPKKGAKAQKAPVKRGISDELIPIEEETWLLQPIAVTMMRHDYSLIQVRFVSLGTARTLQTSGKTNGFIGKNKRS